MPLTKGEQFTLFILFQLPTSQFRMQMEGIKGVPDITANPPGPPGTAAIFHARLKSLAPFLGIASTDLVPSGNQNVDSIWIDPATGNPNQHGNISTDPQVIATALGLPYQPGNPCPGDSDQSRLAVGIVAGIGV